MFHFEKVTAERKEVPRLCSYETSFLVLGQTEFGLRMKGGAKPHARKAAKPFFKMKKEVPKAGCWNFLFCLLKFPKQPQQQWLTDVHRFLGAQFLTAIAADAMLQINLGQMVFHGQHLGRAVGHANAATDASVRTEGGLWMEVSFHKAFQKLGRVIAQKVDAFRLWNFKRSRA